MARESNRVDCSSFSFKPKHSLCELSQLKPLHKFLKALFVILIVCRRNIPVISILFFTKAINDICSCISCSILLSNYSCINRVLACFLRPIKVRATLLPLKITVRFFHWSLDDCTFINYQFLWNLRPKCNPEVKS